MISDRIRRLLPAVLASLIILLGAGAAGTADPMAAPGSVATAFQHHGPDGKDTLAPAAGQPHQSAQQNKDLLLTEPIAVPRSSGRMEYVADSADGPAGRGVPGQGSRAPPTATALT